MLHIADAAERGYSNILVRTLDTDVVVLAVATVLHIGMVEIWIAFGTGKYLRSVTVARSSAVQASSSRRQERRWAIVCGSQQSQSPRLGVVEIAPSPHHCFRTAHSCAQSVKGSPTETVLSRSSRQRLGHLQSQFDGGCLSRAAVCCCLQTSRAA